MRAATYAHRLTKDDGDRRLEPAGRARPQPRFAGCIPGRTRSRSHGHAGSSCAARASSGGRRRPRAAPGTIVEAHGDRLLVATGAGSLRADRDPGRRQAADDARASSSPAIALDAGRPVHRPPTRHDRARPGSRPTRSSRAVSAGSADLPTAIALARGGAARRARPRAGRRDRHRRPALARGARSPHRRSSPSATIDRLDPEIVEILRLSAYQLLHLTRVPASAVVDDAVNLARRAGKRSASGFVNAVLRTISRQRDVAAAAAAARRSGRSRRPRSTTSASRCRTRAGWPRAGTTGSASTPPRRGMQFNNAPAPLTLRANRLRMTPQELVEPARGGATSRSHAGALRARRA